MSNSPDRSAGPRRGPAAPLLRLRRSIVRHRRLRPGLTFVELLLALAVTGVIAAAVASMMFATRHATTAGRGMRGVVVRDKAVRDRIDAAIRSSRMILAHGDDYLVLWMADTRSNQAPNLSELRRIEFDAATGRLLAYQAPSGLSDAADTQYDLLNADFSAVTDALKGSADFPAQVWATRVTDWTIRLDVVDPREAKRVDYRLRVASAAVEAEGVASVTLRRHME